MMAKSQPKQHGEPGFMMRKSGQPNHKPYASGQQGFVTGHKPQSNSRTVIASPPPKLGLAAKSPITSPSSAAKSISPSPVPAYFPPTTLSPAGALPSGLHSPPVYGKRPAATLPPYATATASTRLPYGGPPPAATLPYSIAAGLPYSTEQNSYSYHLPAYPSTGMQTSTALPPSLGAWTAPHAAHPHSMAAYQYQMAQQMSAQMTSYMMAQSMPMAYPAMPAMGMRPPGPRPPPGSPPPKH